jgi:hypothetical protein
MEVDIGIGAVAFERSGCTRELADESVMDDEAEFLLRDVRLAPDLSCLWQEHAADQWSEFAIA